MTEGFIQNVQFDLFEGFIQNVQFDLFEGFIQNVQFDLFSVELVIGDTDTATLLLAENYVTIREVFVDGAKVEPNENKQIFLTSGGGGDSLWELNDGDILQPKENKTFTIKKSHEVDTETGSTEKYLNEQGDFTKPITSHIDVTDKNQEPEFQHVTQEEKDLISSTATIVSGHTEDIAELQTNKVDKATTLSGYGITDAYTKTEIDTKLNNTRTYKILNTPVSTWTASTAYTKYPYKAVIPIENIKESDSVEVIYSIPDAESTNYAAGGELYNGYIKIFSKVNTEITIPTLVITKIDL